jgi:Antitoxin Phd_YefM, type II toxin-antitoxin system
MKTFNEKTTVIGVSELRDIEKILEKAKGNKIIIEKRDKMLAVLLDFKKYEHLQRILDALGDFALGVVAKERVANSKLRDYIDICDL